ncbi:MAG: efflux RND transporter periplasmic adaptor subunit [Balneolales bacterium]
MKSKTKRYMYGTGLLLIGLLSGYLIFGPSSQDLHNDHDHDLEMTEENGVEVWTCSMHPSVREDGPGNCPICGMELIPATSETEENDYAMMMTEAAVKLAQIQTTLVIRDIPKKELHLPGRITVDERQITRVTTHFPGRIRNLNVGFTGAPIKEGEPMATVYSPELINAQRELLEAVSRRESNPRLLEAARQKLRLWELSEEQIQQIEQRGEVMTEVEILSPVDGYVISRNIAEEQHVTEGTVIYEVANLDPIWVVLEAYEEDLAWISTGDLIQFTTRSNSGRTYEAAVSYIDPVVDGGSRTVGIRADIENNDGTLKPGMLVRAQFAGRIEGSEKLMVPASTVLWTGPRSLVYVKDTSADVPRFEVKEVELGLRSGDYYVIEDGLEEGQEVVFNGAFRIDSEFQLADKFSMMNREPGSGAGTPRMPGMDMEEEEMDDMDMDTENTGQSSINKEQVPDVFRQQFDELAKIYLEIKDALTKDDLETASTNIDSFNETLSDIDMDLVEDQEQMKVWITQQEALKKHIDTVEQAEDLAGFRNQFVLLSGAMGEILTTFGVDRRLYVHFCPMIRDNEGGYWLSENEEIVNPYMEESMRNCGEIIEEINF